MLPEIRRLALEEPGQSRFEVIEVSEALAAQLVLEGAEEVKVGRRQVGGVWWVGYRSPAQLFQLLAGGRSNVRPGIVVQQADFHLSSPLFLDGGGELAQLASVDVGGDGLASIQQLPVQHSLRIPLF